MREATTGWGVGLTACVLGVAGIFAWHAASGPDAESLVVYCAHDIEYAEPLLRQFERETGIRVVPVWDTEATKSLGLVQQILREGEHSRCDVFWNNQSLSTIKIQEAGLLRPYRGAGFQRIPAEFKDPGGAWTGFGGRFRVWIVNTEKMPATPEAIAAALAAEDLSAFAFAQPMFGTTLTHYSLLWQTLGGDALQALHHGYVDRGARVLSGNATVKNVVSEGVCSFGMTDTDDFFVALDAGLPVAQLPIRVEGRTICIPNSVAILRGTQRVDAAERLVEFLLSAESEIALARSGSRQIPLGPVDPDQLPPEVRALAAWTEETADLRPLGPAQDACLAWLKSEYAQ